jgi:hypothetical protein
MTYRELINDRATSSDDSDTGRLGELNGIAASLMPLALPSIERSPTQVERDFLSVRQ